MVIGGSLGIGACVAGATICGVGTTLCFSDVELGGEKTCKSEFMSVTSVKKRGLCGLSSKTCILVLTGCVDQVPVAFE